MDIFVVELVADLGALQRLGPNDVFHVCCLRLRSMCRYECARYLQRLQQLDQPFGQAHTIVDIDNRSLWSGFGGCI